jgi:hypothetical protein
VAEEKRYVYIMGAYTGKTHEEIARNIEKAEAFAIACANRGIPFFCPHTHTRHFEEKARANYEFYMNLGFIFLDGAGAILAVPGYENSEGSRREKSRHEAKGKPIFYPSSPDDEEVMSAIERWAKNG